LAVALTQFVGPCGDHETNRVQTSSIGEQQQR
jgi:hypothetical protein